MVKNTIFTIFFLLSSLTEPQIDDLRKRIGRNSVMKKGESV